MRLKIAEYYASEGAEDPIQVEMPKGTYVVSFHRREVERRQAARVSQSAQNDEIAAGPRARRQMEAGVLVLSGDC